MRRYSRLVTVQFQMMALKIKVEMNKSTARPAAPQALQPYPVDVMWSLYFEFNDAMMLVSWRS
jgi:hypothetical protein